MNKLAAMTEDDAQQQLATPPAPNPMGRDRMQIIETRYVHPWGDETQEPVKVVHKGPIFTF